MGDSACLGEAEEGLDGKGGEDVDEDLGGKVED